MSTTDFDTNSQQLSTPIGNVSDLLYCHPDDELMKLEILIRMCLGQIHQDIGLHRPPVQIFLTALNVIAGYRDTPEIENMVQEYVPFYAPVDSPNVGVCVAWAYLKIGFREYEIFDDEEDEEEWGDGGIGTPDLYEITQRLKQLLGSNGLPNNPAIFQALIILILNVLVAGAKPDFKQYKVQMNEQRTIETRVDTRDGQQTHPSRRANRAI